MPQPPVVAVANQKGGVGKTTTTLGLAGAAARDNRRVLVVDVDPQSNATSVLLGDAGRTCTGVWPIASGQAMDISAAIQPASPSWRGGELGGGGVDVMPSGVELGTIELDPDIRQPRRLARAFEAAADVIGRYDLVLVDCPPNVGRNFTSAMILASHVVFVAEPGLFSSQGLGAIAESLRILDEAGLGDPPALLGVLVNKYDRTAETAFRYAEIREHFGAVVFGAYIPAAVVLKSAVSAGEPIQTFTASRAREIAMLYDLVWFEMTSRLAPAVTR